MDEVWLSNAFQMSTATGETAIEVAMVVSRGGTHFDKNEEQRGGGRGYLVNHTMAHETQRGMPTSVVEFIDFHLAYHYVSNSILRLLYDDISGHRSFGVTSNC